MPYYVYFLTNKINTVLYTGVTNNIHRRLDEHRSDKGFSFVQKYKLTKLVYVEATDDVEAAITREKQIKKWNRKKKNFLIGIENTDWKDLSQDWCSA